MAATDFSCIAAEIVGSPKIYSCSAEKLIGENRHLVTIELVEFEKFPAEVETAKKSPIMLEESIEHAPIQPQKTGGCRQVTGWTCQH